MVGVAGDVAGGGALDLADGVGIAVPDGLAFAVGLPCAFDLIGGSGGSPQETIRKLVRLRWNAGGEGQIVGLKLAVLIEGKSYTVEIRFGE